MTWKGGSIRNPYPNPQHAPPTLSNIILIRNLSLFFMLSQFLSLTYVIGDIIKNGQSYIYVHLISVLINLLIHLHYSFK